MCCLGVASCAEFKVAHYRTFVRVVIPQRAITVRVDSSSTASRQLLGGSSLRRIQRRSPMPRLYQQARHTLLCFVLIESAYAVIRYEPTCRRQFLHLAMRRGRAIAKVAMARKLSVRLYWMWRKGWDYQQTSEVRFARGVARNWVMVCRRSPSN